MTRSSPAPGVVKIGIIGMPKSGTSALYSSIKAALPQPRRLVFEPRTPQEFRYIWRQKNENALVKLMFGARAARLFSAGRLTHGICIVRDPRDMLVSSLLFRFNRLDLIKDTELSRKLIAAFKRKELDPESISVIDTLDLISRGEAQKFISRFASNLNKYASFIDARPSSHVLKYEDMIAGRLADASAFLGFEVRPPERLQGWIEKIDRKGEEGDWKNWLCDTDIAFFKPHVESFLDHFGYDQNWTTNAHKVILPEHCSGYIERLSKLRKIDPSAAEARDIGLASLKSAAEDGKATAMQRLARGIIDKREPWGEPALAYDLLFRLGEMGHGNEAVEAGRYYLKLGRRKKAMAAFRLGVEAGKAPAFFFLGRRLMNTKRPEQVERGFELIQRGAELGSESCKKLMAEHAAADG